MHKEWQVACLLCSNMTTMCLEYTDYSILRLKKHLLKRELRGQNQFSVIGRYFSQGLVFHSSELCNLLKISVNELLTGEHIAMENYKEKAEENLLELQEKKVKAQKSLLRTELVWLAIAILLAPVHLAINYYYPNNSGTGVGLLLAIIGIIMFVIYFFRNYEIKLK